LSLLIFLLIGCRNHEDILSLDIPADLFSEGDLVFRKGISLSSQMVLMGDQEGAYSHVGILIRDSSGKWEVIHAVPEEAVETGGIEVMKREPLTRFWQSDRAVAGAVVSYPMSDSIRALIIKKSEEIYLRRLLFDQAYNLSDSTQMYCTELVVFIYHSVGIDLTEGRSHSIPGFRKVAIFPSDILRNERLENVYHFVR